MAVDVLSEQAPLFLGSRLKRLGERLQAGATKVVAEAGMSILPSHMPLLAALDRGPMSVGALVEAVGFSQPGVTRSLNQLVAMGLVETLASSDRRRRTMALTADGRAALARAKALVWPRIDAAVRAMCDPLAGALLDQLSAIETALDAQPLEARAALAAQPIVTIREFSDELAPAFHDINVEWITATFTLEQTDRDVLEDPRGRILDGGGQILFAEVTGLGVVGTCALQKTGTTSYELTKMGVTGAARGLKAGEALLEATIARALSLGADPLYLLTNTKAEAAIHLYEKLGFEHDAEIMARYGARYARCNVAMRYCGKTGSSVK